MTSRSDLDPKDPAAKRELLRQLLERKSPEGAGAPRNLATGPTRRASGSPAVLSPAQERMWFLHQLRPDTATYVVPWAAELPGPVDTGVLDA
ncbi:hypothetical protein ACLESD_44920, partial [Pyxidicoccus sp. 3LFB2]